MHVKMSNVLFLVYMTMSSLDFKLSLEYMEYEEDNEMLDFLIHV